MVAFAALPPKAPVVAEVSAVVLRRTRTTRRRPIMSGSAPCIALSAASVAAASVPLLFSAVAAGTTCSFDSNAHVVTVQVASEEPAFIRRDGSFIEVNRARCRDPFLQRPTVSTTDLIDVNAGPGKQWVYIDLNYGGFEPGSTDEAGTSDEIEFNVALGGGVDTLEVVGSEGNDRVRFGLGSGVAVVNLNANEPDGIDADASATGVEQFGGGASSSGNDKFSGTGGRGTGGVFSFQLTLYGGLGNDRLTGGSAADKLIDPAGPSAPDDSDVLKGRGSADSLNASDFDSVDRVFGGPGVDACSVDAGDQTDSC
jgi:hypothetical protein